MLKMKSESLVFWALTLLILASLGGTITNTNHKVEEISSTDGSDQNENVKEDTCDECKCVIETFIEHEKHIQHLRETGWLLSKPNSDLEHITLWRSGILSTDQRSGKDVYLGIEDSYKLVTEKIKEDFPEADFTFNPQSLAVDISPSDSGEFTDNLLVIWLSGDYEFGSTFHIIGTPTIENADEIIEKILVAWTRVRHPVISNNDVAKYTPPSFRKEDSCVESKDKHGKISFEYCAEVELKK